MDSVINDFCKELKKHARAYLYNRLPEYFQTITYQQIVNLTTGVSGVIGISDLRQGDVFNYPQFISTSYNPGSNLSTFARKDNRSILRIRIPKSCKRWMFLGAYAKYPTENEILIKRNTKFIVTNISKAIINYSTLTEYRLIDVDIIDNDDQLVRAASNINPDIINMSPLFVVAAKYAYVIHLSTAYTEHNLATICPGRGFNYDVKLNININGIDYGMKITSTQSVFVPDINTALNDWVEAYKNILYGYTHIIWVYIYYMGM